MHTSELTD